MPRKGHGCSRLLFLGIEQVCRRRSSHECRTNFTDPVRRLNHPHTRFFFRITQVETNPATGDRLNCHTIIIVQYLVRSHIIRDLNHLLVFSKFETFDILQNLDLNDLRSFNLQ